MLCGFFPLLTLAQQDPIQSLYLNNPVLVNPAYAGIYNQASLGMSYRNQWSGIEGTPTTGMFNFHTALNENKTGAGLMVVNDQVGVINTLEVAGMYTYRINFEKAVLSMGLQAGLFNIRHDYQDLLIGDPDQVFQNQENVLKPNFGAGIMYHTSRFFAGLSVPRLLNLKTSIDAGEAGLYNRHFYALAGGLIDMGPKTVFKPVLFTRYVAGAPVNFDLRADFIYNEFIMAGFLARNFDQFGFTVGLFPANKFRLLYQYEMPLKAFENRWNSHEISVGFDLSLFSFHAPSFRYF